MILDSFGAVLGFFLLVAPGVVYLWLLDRRRPSPKQSTFYLVSRVVLASAILTSFSVVVILVASGWLNEAWNLELTQWIRGTEPDDASLATPALFFVCEVALAIALAIALDAIVGRRLYGPANINTKNEWEIAITRVPSDIAADSAQPFASVLLEDETVIRGYIAEYSVALDLDDREITLVAPITRAFVQENGEEIRTVLPEAQIVIPGRRIVSLGVMHVEGGPATLGG